MTVLYITQNGVTTHIGQSQVTPYLLGLARAGVKITLLSAEPCGQDAEISKHERIFGDIGIRWERVTYRNTPPILGPVLTQARLHNAATKIVKKGGISIVHCRSHPPSIIGYRLKQRYNLRFIFDFRDFYADWGLQNTRGIKRFFYLYIKTIERNMIRSADKIICLTERGSKVLNTMYLSGQLQSTERFTVIPCCADFTHFDLTKVPKESVAQLRSRLGIPEDATVLVYLGSLGIDYLLKPMLDLFRNLLSLQPLSYFLFICNNGRELILNECVRQGLSTEKIRIENSSRDMIPRYLALATFSVIFIRADHTKVGCSPTKLAELFACNIPVIANSGLGDLDSIISASRNSSVLVNDFTDASLRDALTQMNSLANDFENRKMIRTNSGEFALDKGVERYLQVYRDLTQLAENSIL